MAVDKTNGSSDVKVGEVDPATGKKKRKPFTRKPTELAVVARVTDESGNAIEGANIEIVLATKDVATAFRKYKETPGSDMTTFTMGEKKDAEVNKAA